MKRKHAWVLNFTTPLEMARRRRIKEHVRHVNHVMLEPGCPQCVSRRRKREAIHLSALRIRKWTQVLRQTLA